MIVDTPDGPKFDWEVDEATAAAARAATAAAAEAARERAEERATARRREIDERLEASACAVLQDTCIIDPSLVELAQHGDIEALKARLKAGCNVDVVAFEYDLYPGSKRMFCNDWTPLSAAAAAGEEGAVALLLEARADPDILCCCSTSSGVYKCWSALDCARTGDTVPFERDHAKHLQPRHAGIERLLLAAGARPGSALGEPLPVNTYGLRAEVGQRPNPCLDEAGAPLRPVHLYDPAEEDERRRVPGAPRLGRGVGGCPMTSIGMEVDDRRDLKAARDRIYTGGSKAYRRTP